MTVELGPATELVGGGVEGAAAGDGVDGATELVGGDVEGTWTGLDVLNDASGVEIVLLGDRDEPELELFKALESTELEDVVDWRPGSEDVVDGMKGVLEAEMTSTVPG